MKHLFAFCLFITPITFAFSASIPNQFTWQAPNSKTDGSLLLPSEIMKHTVKCGLRPGAYTLKMDIAMPVVDAPIDFATPGGNGYRYCVVTATDKNGEESLPGKELKFYLSAGIPMIAKPEKIETTDNTARLAKNPIGE